jgi:flagellar hook assembly protein FlgD
VTFSPTFSYSPTPIGQPYTVTLGVFNSAGEQVDSVYSGYAQNSISQAQETVLGPQSNGEPVVVTITGLGGNAADLVWTGTNQNGQAVQGGIYYIKLCSTDVFGTVTCQVYTVTVQPPSSAPTLQIYNSAGEVVDTLNVAGLSAAPVNLELQSGQSGGVIPSSNPKALTPTGGVTFNVVLQNGTAVPVYWNGLSASGQPLASGTYMVQLSSSQAGAQTLVKTLPVTLLASQNQSVEAMAASALVVPNPVVSGANGFSVRYEGDGVDSAVGVLYDLAGERVAQASQMPVSGPGLLQFSAKLSGGIYVLDFEVADSKVALARRVLKVAIVK